MSEVDIRPHLDHVFITVAGEVLTAISDNRFLADGQFGRFFVKNATSTLLGPYRTMNLLGRNTGIELFSEDAPPFPDVRVGVVMSFDHPGESLRARAQLDQRGVKYHHELVRRTVPDQREPVPWYHLVRPDFGERSGFTLFLSEVTAECFELIGAKRGADGAHERHAYLDAVVKAPHQPTHNFEDIERVVLELDPAQAELLATILTALGYRAENRGALQLSGPEAEIEIRRVPQARGRLVELGLRLRAPHTETPSVHSFGSASQLALSPDGRASAVWRFDPTGDAAKAVHS
jgi:hypothetical protein